jgi:hypothetical protein
MDKEELKRKLESLKTELKSNVHEVRRHKLQLNIANIERNLDNKNAIKKGKVEIINLFINDDRYLTLYPTKLQYKEKEYSTDIKGEIDLNEIALVRVLPKNGHFEIVDRGRTYKFHVDDKVEASKWVTAIKAQIKILRGNTTLADSASAEAANAFQKHQQRLHAVKTTNTRGWSNVQHTGNDNALLQKEVAQKQAEARKLLTPQEEFQHALTEYPNPYPDPYALKNEGGRRKTRYHSKTLCKRKTRQREQHKTRRHRRS